MSHLTRSFDPGQPDVVPVDAGTDREWLDEEAASLLDGPDADGVRSVAAWAVKSLTAAMKFHGHDSAAGFVADAVACRAPDLIAALPGMTPWERTTGLARALDVLASWHLSLDAPAALLAAWVVTCRATEADALGSETGRDFEYDEAACRMARDEASIEDGYCYL